jgi:hypothetical protein
MGATLSGPAILGTPAFRAGRHGVGAATRHSRS